MCAPGDVVRVIHKSCTCVGPSVGHALLTLNALTRDEGGFNPLHWGAGRAGGVQVYLVEGIQGLAQRLVSNNLEAVWLWTSDWPLCAPISFGTTKTQIHRTSLPLKLTSRDQQSRAAHNTAHTTGCHVAS